MIKVRNNNMLFDIWGERSDFTNETKEGGRAMGVGVKVRVWGDYALFSRPEMKVERCSYDVMTPSAAIRISMAVYWHPGMALG